MSAGRAHTEGNELMGNAWVVNLIILALVIIGAALIMIRGHVKGNVRRVSPEERAFLRERGINTHFGSLRKLSTEERRAFEDRRTSDAER